MRARMAAATLEQIAQLSLSQMWLSAEPEVLADRTEICLACFLRTSTARSGASGAIGTKLKPRFGSVAVCR